MSWRPDETYVKVRGEWKYLYRAVDKDGSTINFLLTARRDLAAARHFLRKAIRNNGKPDKITIDKTGANQVGIKDYNVQTQGSISIRQSKYLNNMVEQDHRRIKRKINPILGVKSFQSAKVTLAGIEILAMLKKQQSDCMPLFFRSYIDAYYQLTA